MFILTAGKLLVGARSTEEIEVHNQKHLVNTFTWKIIYFITLATITRHNLNDTQQIKA